MQPDISPDITNLPVPTYLQTLVAPTQAQFLAIIKENISPSDSALKIRTIPPKEKTLFKQRKGKFSKNFFCDKMEMEKAASLLLALYSFKSLELSKPRCIDLGSFLYGCQVSHQLALTNINPRTMVHFQRQIKIIHPMQ